MTEIRNIAIIAHVDHGKTTLVDQILKQTHIFRNNQEVRDCFLDSNDLERERGITILAKNISVHYKDVKINIIDTPGHSDFGGQVERVLNLADGVLLLVDAAEGPLPQTRFVLDKALKLHLKPIVLINKIDRADARAEEVLDKVYDLFLELHPPDELLDFPVIYSSGRNGWADTTINGPRDSIFPLMDAIISYVPGPKIIDGPVQMQVATIDYSDYLGRIGIGRVYRGNLDASKPLCIIKRNGDTTKVVLTQLQTFEGIERIKTDKVTCGDLCTISGIADVDIGDTICDAETPEALPPISVDEPTISMVFRINDSPFYGQDGKYVNSRHIRERLFKEIQKDVALKVDEISGDSFKVSGRGVLHLSILIENMRREGYELAISQPQVILKEVDGQRHEPIEVLTVDVPTEYSGKVIEVAGMRKGEMFLIEQHGQRHLLEFYIPTRGIIGIRSRILTSTAGQAIVSHRFSHYGPFKGEMAGRTNGVLISMCQGKAVPYAIDGLQLRGIFFIDPNETTYEGMIVGEHCKGGDLVVNLQRGKQLTNMRASGSDRNMKIAPAQKMNLEEALEYIAADELVEATPSFIRIRKRYLTELDRKRFGKKAAEQE